MQVEEGAAIVSLFADDPDIAPILEGFTSRLSDQIDAMRQACAEGRHEDLQRMAHKLKGAGGSYGYPTLTESCLALEDAAKAGDAITEKTSLDIVAAIGRNIQNGYHTHPLTVGTL